MQKMELTSENIEAYLSDCLELQTYLVKPDEKIAPEQFILTANNQSTYFLALLEEDRVVAMGVINKVVHPVRINTYVDNIVVHPDFRGQGLFSVLMNELEGISKDWGAETIQLTCSRSEVQPLYEKRGYSKKETNFYTKNIADY